MANQSISSRNTRVGPWQVGRPRAYLPLARYVGVYALLLLALALAIIPLLWALAASFTPGEKVFEYVYPVSWRAFIPLEFTIEAYRASFARGLGRAAINTLLLGITTVLLGGLFSAMAGFAFARFTFPGKRLLFILVLFAFMVPSEVTIIPLYILIQRLDWINTWQALIVPSLANGVIIFLFRQFFADIPQDLIDAARVDGASWLRLFVRIVLPISKPVLITSALLLFLSQWDSFFWPLLVAPKAEFRVIQVAISSAIQERRTLWNELLAGSIVAAIVPILLILPFQRYYVSAITGTGVKE
jgi:multiple sugar transport system permease protein